MTAGSVKNKESFSDLEDTDLVILTSFHKNGTPVDTKVHFAVEAGRGNARTYDATWKYKRIRRNPAVEIAPATASGPARRHPILHGWLIPAYHRMRGWRTVEMELTAAG